MVAEAAALMPFGETGTSCDRLTPQARDCAEPGVQGERPLLQPGMPGEAMPPKQKQARSKESLLMSTSREPSSGDQSIVVGPGDRGTP